MVEDITDREFLDDYPDAEYSKAVIDYFDDPAAIWERAFRSMSDASQILLLVLTTFPDLSYYSELENAFDSTYSFFASKKKWKQGLNDYKDALAELDGSPVKVTKVRFTNYYNAKKMPEDGLAIEFENPSIRDYLENYLLHNAEAVRYLFQSSIYFEQTYYLLSLRVGEARKNILESLLPLKEEVFNGIYKFLENGVSCSRIRPFKYAEKVGYYVDKDWCAAEKMSRIISQFRASQFMYEDDLRDICNDFLSGLDSYENTLTGLLRLGDAIKALNENVKNPIDISETKIRFLILKNTQDVDDYYRASSYLFDESEDNDTLEQRLYEVIYEEAGNALSDDELSADQLSDLRDKISYLSSVGLLNVDDIDGEIDTRISDILARDDDESDDDHVGDKQDYGSLGFSNMQRMDAEIKSIFDEMRESFT